ncbi:low molecular weight protein-tyrosine-phosphatase [Pasteurella atlantica]|uniref:Low molecular weight protein-tyrosine-phosphatase n=2 Tax=Pasteurellaceae TaxID=712 RepID=A0ACC6HMT9_9PAST|nr:low molecular weight protein-tyrosine-phosphatase [Pasteurella atlantica]MDP8052118.1 low molecular weight protein-tyrosine-phosphatase [Pasteurella atlantica]MDP8105259.1 low molecular weight protein-tyrosine-phosphatase [Pasteurella atlantica]MDP8149020.1 low molecular weight protein-tyrosine-phosphatase [Pasteurella atlantica]
MKPQTNILFVCLGNICRSPMAEYIMRHKIKQAHLENCISTDSAGTSGWHDGEDMHKGTKQQLAKYQIDNSGFVSRKVKKQDWEKFDYIVAMDNQNLKDLELLFGKNKEKLFNVTSLCPDLAYDHIPDPWYTGNFDETYQLLAQCCEVLLQRVRGNYI